ncbi:TetR/AcrR family transcriptional regulator [Conexibacter arvalis]|uniref:AcrR family transcriptional regulator n=1 Tax=Conexibacter arvalis TaxID=912552 RepID=A0A840IAT7_9ACTN|nr:TetR/AcrR family transcriptional regulator [Conexibacter arvalis]MBB4661363.1 AcrR family transcriptional regulator [Conexibacter arvalis]
MATRTEPRGTRGSHDPEQTRRLLIDSALALFSDRGFHGTSVQEIVERAHVTKGAFYHHFDSKEDVLALIHERFLDAWRASLERIVAELASPADQLREAIRESVLAVARHRQQVAVFFQERRCLTGRRALEVDRKRDAIDRAMDAIVHAGVEQGLFDRRTTARVAVLGIVGMSAWVHQWYRPEDPMPADRVADELAALALDGLLVR